MRTVAAGCALWVLAVAGVAAADPAPASPPDEGWAPIDDAADGPFGPRYLIEGVIVRGNRRTESAFILREVGIAPGDVIAAGDERVTTARLRLLSLGHFLSVRLSLDKGARRGAAVLIVEVEERGTLIVNAIHLGSSEATGLWGGLDVAETNFLGRGLVLGGGFVGSTRPRVPEAVPALALDLRAGGTPARAGGLALGANVIFSRGSEFFRTSGAEDEADPDGFVALRTRRVGGGLVVGTDLSRTTRVALQGRFESIAARMPSLRTRTTQAGALRPISFDVHEGASRVASAGVTIDFDGRSDPILPSHGSRLLSSLEVAVPPFGSHYTFAKGLLRGSVFISIGPGHVLGFHGLAGAIFGDAPYFDQFFVGDLNALLPPRALGINFSTLPSRDLLDTGIESHRYNAFAGRALAEYAVPIMGRRRGLVYRGQAFAGIGAFGMASADDLRVRDRDVWSTVAFDLTADLGVRLDTYIGIFTLSVANALGRIPF